MTRKAKVERTLPPGWVVSDQVTVNKRTVVPGTELSIQGVSGRFRFIKHVKTDTAEWVDVVGGRKGVSTFRSFPVSRIKRVHRINKTRENARSADG